MGYMGICYILLKAIFCLLKGDYEHNGRITGFEFAGLDRLSKLFSLDRIAEITCGCITSTGLDGKALSSENKTLLPKFQHQNPINSKP